MRNKLGWVLAIFLMMTMTVSTYAGTAKSVTVVFTGYYTEKQAAIIAQQTFNNLSTDSIGRFSASACNAPPFTYTLSKDRTKLTFTLCYMFDQ